jgi:hypothetical protein
MTTPADFAKNIEEVLGLMRSVQQLQGAEKEECERLLENSLAQLKKVK